MTDLMQEIAAAVIDGRADRNSSGIKGQVGGPGVKELTQTAIDKGKNIREILNKGLLAGVDVVGEGFKAGDLFMPEVILCAQALRAGMDLLRPLIIKGGMKPIGKFVIGTVKGDIHDVGKSLVVMMLEGAGFEVIDLGIDVSKEKFIEVVKREKPEILGMSSLLTSTMGEMIPVINTLEKEGLRHLVKTMIGGAPVTQSFADQVGADGYAVDAMSAVAKAKELLGVN
jgi:5-methyltetrahydrofolate--homocysteine methyltransferase